MASSPNYQKRGEDEDSLFGSPPPSPGRSPSPALALPYASGLSTSIVTKNVGTVALPGSQPYSELFVNPLASSLSCDPAPRPPAHVPTVPINPARPWNSNLSRSSSITTSPSPGPSSLPLSATTRPKKKRKAATESAPRPEAQIKFPNPSVPLPSHFLRNQSALLGMAGLVGGVNPSVLTHHPNTRGAILNPIVVEEEESDAPILGRNTTLRLSTFLPPNVSQLPIPSVQEIVDMLIKQRDIFPVLENILKLIASGSQALKQPPSPRMSAFSRQNSSHKSEARIEIAGSHATGYPIKKRKLNRVPAGAADWDVPYPFAQGEGPELYQVNWEHERGKQLISQLVGLIKIAAKKAATKRYIEHHHPHLLQQKGRQNSAEKETLGQFAEPEPRVNKYYKPATAMYGRNYKEPQTPLESRQILPDTSTANLDTQATPRTPSSSVTPTLMSTVHGTTPTSSGAEQSRSSGSFDQLISSLLSASSTETIHDLSNGPCLRNTSSNAASSADITSLMCNLDPSTDRDFFDTWMSVLQTFPAPDGGFSHLAQQQPMASSFSSPASFDDFDFSDLGIDLDQACPADISADNIATSSGNNSSSVMTMYSPMPKMSESHHFIDPELLPISMPGSSSVPASSAPSPIPSMSSFGGTDPATPISTNWDMTTPEIYMGGGSNGFVDDDLTRMGFDGGGQGMWSHPLWAQNGTRSYNVEGEDPAIADFMASFGVHSAKQNITEAHMGKEREDISPFPHQTDKYVSDPSNQPTSQVAPPTASSPSTNASQTSKSLFAIRTEDVIQRARNRKDQLTAELNRVKLQLWETTIEQAALTHVVSYYQEQESHHRVTDRDVSTS